MTPTEVVARLRKRSIANLREGTLTPDPLSNEAADHIERLSAALENVKTQLDFWHRTARAAEGQPTMPRIQPSLMVIDQIDAALNPEPEK